MMQSYDNGTFEVYLQKGEKLPRHCNTLGTTVWAPFEGGYHIAKFQDDVLPSDHELLEPLSLSVAIKPDGVL